MPPRRSRSTAVDATSNQLPKTRPKRAAKTKASSKIRSNSHNLWTAFPPEIKNRILNMSDALTQHLNSHGLYAPAALENQEEMVKQQLQNDIWRAALEMEWKGEFKILPGSFQPKNKSEWYPLVTSKDLYLRLQKLSKSKLKKVHQDTVLHIAMRHMWLDMLEDPVKKPKKYFDHAIVGGHIKFMRHINKLGLEMEMDHWRECADVIAEEGGVEDMKALWNTFGQRVCTHHVLDVAAEYGQLDILKFLREEIGCSTGAMDIAIENSHLHIVRYLHEMNEPCTTKTMDEAAKKGQLQIVRFLHENSSEGCTTAAMNDAAAEGHLDIVEFLHKNRSEGCTTDAMDISARRGHLNVVRFLHENRHEGCTAKAMDYAAEYGHFEIVKFLNENRREGCTCAALEGACSTGYLNIVEYLLKVRNEPVTETVWKAAISSGRLNVLEFLQAVVERKFSSKDLAYAAKSGNIEMVKCIHNQLDGKLSMDNVILVMHAAQRRDRFEIIKYLKNIYPDSYPSFCHQRTSRELELNGGGDCSIM
ncbi:hypothetical protein HDV05_000502 [Chytridiales sp. JEL 0842]|nr:hypothetical protein HDV05_000502 [Chytridiales sp. JEL 0842]